jgi:hypothetical protein
MLHEIARHIVTLHDKGSTYDTQGNPPVSRDRSLRHPEHFVLVRTSCAPEIATSPTRPNGDSGPHAADFQGFGVVGGIGVEPTTSTMSTRQTWCWSEQEDAGVSWSEPDEAACCGTHPGGHTRLVITSGL